MESDQYKLVCVCMTEWEGVIALYLGQKSVLFYQTVLDIFSKLYDLAAQLTCIMTKLKCEQEPFMNLRFSPFFRISSF